MDDVTIDAIRIQALFHAYVSPKSVPGEHAALTAAVAAKHLQPQQIPCALCQEPVRALETTPVIVASRVAGGRILFRAGEPWCPGCATLMYRLEPFRHFDLMEDDR